MERRLNDIRKKCMLSCTMVFISAEIKCILDEISMNGGRLSIQNFQLTPGSFFDICFSIGGSDLRCNCICLNFTESGCGFMFYMLFESEKKIIEDFINGAVSEPSMKSSFAFGRKMKILSLGVGAVKAVSQIAILERLEHITGKKITEIFDMIVGVSSGGMNAALISAGFSLREIKEFYFSRSRDVFRTKLAFWESFYDSNALKRAVDELLPSSRYFFKNTKCELLILSRNLENSILYCFSTLKNPEMPLSSAVMRTTALPVVFGPWEELWMDGGVGSLVNPAEAGIRYAVSLGQRPSDITVIYLDSGLDPNRLFRKEDKNLLSHLSWSLNMLARDHIFSSTARIKYHFPDIRYFPYFFTFSRFFDLLETRDLRPIYDEALLSSELSVLDIIKNLNYSDSLDKT